MSSIYIWIIGPAAANYHRFVLSGVISDRENLGGDRRGARAKAKGFAQPSNFAFDPAGLNRLTQAGHHVDCASPLINSLAFVTNEHNGLLRYSQNKADNPFERGGSILAFVDPNGVIIRKDRPQ